MPYSLPHRAPRRRSGGDRVFADDAGRLWSVALQAPLPPPPRPEAATAALVFACISDAREPSRAIALDPALGAAVDAADDTLRGWLREAPAVGMLI